MLDFDLPKVEEFDPDLNAQLPASGKTEISALQLIRQGYQSTPPTRGNFNEAISALSHIVPDLPELVTLESLMAWEEQHLKAGDLNPDTLRDAMLHLDPRAIARLAGLEPLIWTNLRDKFHGIGRDDWHDKFLSRHDHSTAWMGVAACATQSLSGEAGRVRAAYALYEFMRIVGNPVAFEDSSGDLSQFARENRKQDPLTLNRFQLEGLCIHNGNWFGANHKYGRISREVGVGDTFYSFYLDGPAAIVLQYDNNPVAVVAATVTDPKSLLINQIQTIHPRKLIAEKPELAAEDLDTNRWELEPFIWREFLFNTIARMAYRSGLQSIGIQSAANNKWTKPAENGEIHLPATRAVRIYDTLAEKLQLTQGEDGNYWTKIKDVI